jgi:Fic family protein
VRIDNNWSEWIVWLLNGVSTTSRQTVELIRQIKQLMNDFQQKIQVDAANIYSKELLDSLFKHPYTKIKFIEDDLGVHRQTAAKYLDQLVELELLTSHKIGKSNYYINHSLFDLLSTVIK